MRPTLRGGASKPRDWYSRMVRDVVPVRATSSSMVSSVVVVIAMSSLYWYPPPNTVTVNDVTIEPPEVEAEQLGERVLETVRAETSASGIGLASPLEPISGGFWARTYGLVLRDAPAPFDRRLILRVMPDEDLARREIAIQGAVAALGFPCPMVRLADARSARLGAPFII